MMTQELRRFFHSLNKGFDGNLQGKSIQLRKPRIQLKILFLLQREGFIDSWHPVNFEKSKKFDILPPVQIKFRRIRGGRKFKIQGLKETNLSLREICGYDYHRGFNCLILTTTKGILTHRECIRYGLGGIPLCELRLI